MHVRIIVILTVDQDMVSGYGSLKYYYKHIFMQVASPSQQKYQISMLLVCSKISIIWSKCVTKLKENEKLNNLLQNL